MKVYGPYTRKDGRQHVIIIHDDGRRQTMSYPKYLKEQELGVSLAKDEIVHHDDEDFTNNELSNLKVLDRVNHAKLHNPATYHKVICNSCQRKFELTTTEYRKRLAKCIQRQSKGMFCSRSCSGKNNQY